MISSLFSTLVLRGLPQLWTIQRLQKRVQRLTVSQGHILDSSLDDPSCFRQKAIEMLIYIGSSRNII
jgi:hypothetical protein